MVCDEGEEDVVMFLDHAPTLNVSPPLKKECRTDYIGKHNRNAAAVLFMEDFIKLFSFSKEFFN